MMTPSASEIRNRVAAVYKTCTTYRDTGESTTVFIMGPRPTDRHTTALEFRTAFVRPDRFRFEFTDRAVGPRSEWSRYVVWQNRHRIRSWWTKRSEVEEFPELSSALAGPSGVSKGTAYYVPRLLLAPQGTMILHPSGKLAPDEDLDGVRCHKLVQSSGEAGRKSQTIWISSESLLILRIDQSSTFDAEHQRERHLESIEDFRLKARHDPRAARILSSLEGRQPASIEGFRTEQTIRYSPSIEVDLDDDEFTFDPPS